MKVLSIDIGASSGRFIVVNYTNGKFIEEELFRFKNEMTKIDNHLRWDFHKLMGNIFIGLKTSLTKYPDISSLGVDTWGVDYGLIGKDGNLLFDPIGYRDARNEEAAKSLLTSVDYKNIYHESGIQYLPFNSLLQLSDDISHHIDFDKFLLIPDLINYFLTGKMYCELTNLSTTGLYNPLKKEISLVNTNLIGLSKDKFAELIYPSTLVGKLKKEIADKLGIKQVDIVAVGSHDTASAIASIKLNDHSAYLSSGTWSLLGVELPSPIINLDSYKANFTNEIGLEHTVRFLKNIAGLFIIQEIQKEAKIPIEKLMKEASGVEDNNLYIDINDSCFSKPGDMKNKLLNYLKATNQNATNLTSKQICRAIYESMSFKYIEEFNQLTKLTNKKIDSLLVVGGGVNATLLNQLIANSLNINVYACESEATILGNALSQFIYLKEFVDLSSAREALKSHTLTQTYLPKDIKKYQSKYIEYLNIIRRKN